MKYLSNKFNSHSEESEGKCGSLEDNIVGFSLIGSGDNRLLIKHLIQLLPSGSFFVSVLQDEIKCYDGYAIAKEVKGNFKL